MRQSDLGSQFPYPYTWLKAANWVYLVSNAIYPGLNRPIQNSHGRFIRKVKEEWQLLFWFHYKTIHQDIIIPELFQMQFDLEDSRATSQPHLADCSISNISLQTILCQYISINNIKPIFATICERRSNTISLA